MRAPSRTPPRGLVGRWRQRLHARLARVPELTRLLMKRRNREAWTPEERAFVGRELRALARGTPALVLFLLPGGILWVPVYAWLLDRRRRGRAPGSTPP